MSQKSSSLALKRALISVWDKTNLPLLVKYLVLQGTEIISTGGTYRKIQEILEFNDFINPRTSQSVEPILKSIEELTHSPEILNGRVKTLHPTVYGGLLAKRDNPEHQADLSRINTDFIDLVVVNLYPFHQSFEKNLPLEEAQELIDIGGVSLIRASAKNYQSVILLTNPNQYDQLIQQGPSRIDRAQLAIEGFVITSDYDAQIAKYLKDPPLPPPLPSQIVPSYHLIQPLKYGCNPHQKPAGLYQIYTLGSDPQLLPFQLLNGQLGYINVLDAINSWNLVNEVVLALQTKVPATSSYHQDEPYEILYARVLNGIKCAASFKHTSPAGVGLSGSIEWGSSLCESLGLSKEDHKALSHMASAFIRARNGDPMSSFGDFIALSHTCDVSTAKLIKREVSDGIIAPDYEPEALEILKAKKGGKYLILQGNRELFLETYRQSQATPKFEVREIGGLALVQPRNFAIYRYDQLPNTIPHDVRRDMVLAYTTLKWAQSNTVTMAFDGQVIAVASGQQSRVDCVKLCIRKSQTWFYRQCGWMTQLRQSILPNRKDNGRAIKRQDCVNLITRCIEGNLSDWEQSDFKNYFDDVQSFQTLLNGFICYKGKSSTESFLNTDGALKETDGLILASDAFFPFRDNIDIAAQNDVRWIIQPGGSQADPQVQQACDEYDITMVNTGLRQFNH